jgi:transcriptional regulator with XRE-family HTH domain
VRLQNVGAAAVAIAASIAVRQAAISEIESAKGNPTFTTLEFVAAALGVTIRELLRPTRDR